MSIHLKKSKLKKKPLEKHIVWTSISGAADLAGVR